MLGGLDYHSIAGAVKRALTSAYLYAAAGTGSDGQVLSRDSSQTGGISLVDNPSRPNLLINPNWQIDQINEGALYTFNASSGFHVDGWSGTAVGAGAFKTRVVADPDNAALKCLEITCTTIDAAIAAGDLYYIHTDVEGYDAAALMAGTSAAQSITVQFKLKINVTGVYGVSVTNSATNRSYVGTITVLDTSEHEYSVTLTMDTAGTWLYTNGTGLRLRLCLAGGSTFQTTAGSWQAGAFLTTAAQANFMSNVANVAYLKRIQLIPGSLVQAYKPADIQREFAKCQRYYYKSYTQGIVPGTADASNAIIVGDSTPSSLGNVLHTMYAFVALPVTLRADPTLVGYSPDTGTINKFRDLQNAADIPASFNGTYRQNPQLIFTSSAVTTGPYFRAHFTANARLS